MKNILELNHVKKEYSADGLKTLAVDDDSFSVPEGSFIGVMGASGSGKSTLLNLISTIDRTTSGRILLDGTDLSQIHPNQMAQFRREHLGFIFQDYNLLDTLTLRENIALALTIKELPRAEITKITLETAARLEIEDILDKFPCQVSGGQRQRCACARAVAASPRLILADEPTGALDSHSARNLMETLVMLNREFGATILMVTHDAFSASYCKTILFMKDGKIVHSLAHQKQDQWGYFMEILNTTAKVMGDSGYVS